MMEEFNSFISINEHYISRPLCTFSTLFNASYVVHLLGFGSNRVKNSFPYSHSLFKSLHPLSHFIPLLPSFTRQCGVSSVRNILGYSIVQNDTLKKYACWKARFVYYSAYHAELSRNRIYFNTGLIRSLCGAGHGRAQWYLGNSRVDVLHFVHRVSWALWLPPP